MKKVAIVGMEGSGKTVMLAGLGELYSRPDANGCFLSPKNYETANYVSDKIERMRRGEWPAATAGDALQGLDWTLKRKVGEGRRPEDVCEVSFLDFAGEVYRVAFGVSNNSDLSDEADSLKRYIREADDVIVLINLSDIIVHGLSDPRVREAMWITNGILAYALDEKNGRKMPRAAIVLSQADSYADTIRSCGGVRGVLAKHLPHVANNYDWLDLLSASAVDKTDIDDEGRSVPAKDFKTTGLQPIMDWILSVRMDAVGAVRSRSQDKVIDAPPSFDQCIDPSDKRDVRLIYIGDNKIATIKAIREVTGCGLKDAKDIVDRVANGHASSIVEDVSSGFAEKVATVLKEAGAEVEISCTECGSTEETRQNQKTKPNRGASSDIPRAENVRQYPSAKKRRAGVAGEKVNIVSFMLALVSGGGMSVVCLASGHWVVSIWLGLLGLMTWVARGDSDWKQGAGWWFLYAVFLAASGCLGATGHWLLSAFVSLMGLGLLAADKKK